MADNGLSLDQPPASSEYPECAEWLIVRAQRSDAQPTDCFCGGQMSAQDEEDQTCQTVDFGENLLAVNPSTPSLGIRGVTGRGRCYLLRATANGRGDYDTCLVYASLECSAFVKRCACLTAVLAHRSCR